MNAFKSPKGDIPEIDPTKMDLIISLLTTFESNDLHTRNALNFKFDEKTGFVFLELLAMHNGEKVVDFVFGYDKDKIINVCKNILKYFSEPIDE